MSMLWTLFKSGLIITALDIDNALYMTSAIEDFEEARRRRAVYLGLLIELGGRLAIIVILQFVFGGQEMMITILGVTIPLEAIALVGAGLFLLIRSIRELIDFFKGRQDSIEASITIDQEASFSRRMLEMTLVSLTLSVDTIVAITSSVSIAWQILYLLLFSAIARGLFVRQIAAIIHRLPSLNIVILTFLIVIGIELLLQGLGLEIPEVEFNILIAVAMVVAVIYEMRQRRLTKLLEHAE